VTIDQGAGFLTEVVPEAKAKGGATQAERVDPGRAERIRLVALAFLMLFVELALIRWAGSNVLHLSYFSNFVLLGSFLGIGIGFLRGTGRRNLFPFAPLALAGLVAFVRFFPVEVRVDENALLFFTTGDLASEGPAPWVTLPVIFVVVAAALACLAQGVARSFAKFEPLEAYRLDVVGSILGIAGFSAVSFTGAPPLVWGAIAAGLLLALHPPRRVIHLGLVVLPLVVMLVMLGAETFTAGNSWSPYYKVTVEGDDPAVISVNGVPHQIVHSADTGLFYDEVYDLLPPGPLGEVLIIGSGSGNDVAVALNQGAERIDAVEIDPRIHELGEELHPDQPYADPRVESHIGDGRAFLHRTDRTYDLILFALPDSITLVSGQSSLRLESYLFTQEAVEAVRDRLAPGGTFAMYNYYREPWLVDRLAGTVAEVFGNDPCVSVGDEVFASIAASNDPGSLQCEQRWTPLSADVPAPATDNHPFPYLRDRGLPGFYLVAIALILVASLIGVRSAGGPFRQMSPYVDLFCMGAAFLLLETKHVVQFALLFGTTWFVNALVFAGVLLSVLAAIEVARRWTPRRPGFLYGALAAAVAVAWIVPTHTLLGLAAAPRFAVAVALAFAPIFLANLIFAERFRDVSASTSAFGANLLGAMVGGVLEYFALVIGYRSLLFVVAALYGLAFLTGRKHLKALALRA
jgi:SAM-dependent methyltransferase